MVYPAVPSHFCSANTATPRFTGRCSASRISGHSHQQAQLCLPSLVGFASTDDQNRLEAFYDVQLNLVIVTTARLPSPVSMTRLTKDSSTRSLIIDATFYNHFYHHGATDITRFDNECMTSSFLIARLNLKIKTF